MSRLRKTLSKRMLRHTEGRRWSTIPVFRRRVVKWARTCSLSRASADFKGFQTRVSY